MKIDLLRKVDRTIGLPVMDVISFLRHFKKRRDIPENVNRILIIKLFGFGNFIFLSPAIHNLKKIYPNAKIDVLTFEQNRGICNMYSDIDETKTIRFSIGGMIADIMKFLFSNISKYDLCIDFEQFVRLSAILGLLSNPKCFVGISTKNSGKKYAFDIPVDYPEKNHVVEEYYAVVKKISEEEHKSRYIDKDVRLLMPAFKQNKFTIKETKSMSMNKQIAIGVCVGGRADDVERRYPKEKFTLFLNKLLHREKNVKIYFFGSNSEKKEIQEIIETLCHENKNYRNRVTDLSGIPLNDSAALISKMKIFISNDTGPLHLAASLGVFCIGLYGPSKQWIYGPYTEKKIILRDKRHGPVRSNHNEKDVGWNPEWWPTPDEVYRNVNKVLKKI